MAELKVPYISLPLQHQGLKPALLAAIEKVIDRGDFILGAEVTEFESRFAALCGARYAVGVDNGTSALFLTLRALGIGPGDEVITAPNSFLASASAIALTGAIPVFVDVRKDYTIDPALIERAITSRTKGIIPVHLTGRPAEMNSILDLARHYQIHVVEDCAQAVGARHRGRQVGSFGIAGCFSLHPLKNLSALGDGGVITTDDPELRERLCKARNHGLLNRNECEAWSPNCRLDTIQAAALLIKMDHLAEWTEKRRLIAAYYRDQLGDVVGIPEEEPFQYCVYHTFVIQVEERDALQRHLAAKGIETKVHYPIPIHCQKAAAGLRYPPGSFPVAEKQSRQILSLPIYPELSEEQVRFVAAAIRGFYNR